MYSEQAPHQRKKNFYSVSERNPDDWITGTEPMTSEQKHHLKSLSHKAGENFDDTLSKASAVARIRILQQKVGAGN